MYLEANNRDSAVAPPRQLPGHLLAREVPPIFWSGALLTPPLFAPRGIHWVMCHTRRVHSQPCDWLPDAPPTLPRRPSQQEGLSRCIDGSHHFASATIFTAGRCHVWQRRVPCAHRQPRDRLAGPATPPSSSGRGSPRLHTQRPPFPVVSFPTCFHAALRLVCFSFLNTSYPRTHPLVGSPFPLEQELVIDMNIYVHMSEICVWLGEEGEDRRLLRSLPVPARARRRQRTQNGYRGTVEFEGKMKKPGEAWPATNSLVQLVDQYLISLVWVVAVDQIQAFSSHETEMYPKLIAGWEHGIPSVFLWAEPLASLQHPQ